MFIVLSYYLIQTSGLTELSLLDKTKIEEPRDNNSVSFYAYISKLRSSFEESQTKHTLGLKLQAGKFVKITTEYNFATNLKYICQYNYSFYLRYWGFITNHQSTFANQVIYSLTKPSGRNWHSSGCNTLLNWYLVCWYLITQNWISIVLDPYKNIVYLLNYLSM